MTYERFDMEEVKRLTDGQWDRIYSAIVPDMSRALEKPGRHVPCPSHGGRDGFRIHKDARDGLALCETCTQGKWKDGFGTIMWLTNRSFPDAVLAAVDVVAPGYKAGDKRAAARPVVARPSAKDTAKDVLKERASNAHRLSKLKEVWQASFALYAPEAEIARRYFKARGLEAPHGVEAEVRFVPLLDYFDGAKVSGRYPALVALVRNAKGDAVTIHRTYLASDGSGKAPVEEPKKLMAYPTTADLKGAAIRLGQPQNGSLGVAEGLETALAVMALTGEICWSLVSAYLLTQFVPPEGVEAVWVWGDKDVSGTGQAAVEELVTVLREDGFRAMGVIPPWPVPKDAKSLDWLDVYCAYGTEAIKMIEPFRRVMGKGIGQKLIGLVRRVTG